MPWHLSKSDPRKVYDERHEMVCVCQTAEQAALIVDAIRARQGSLRLQEQEEPEKKTVTLGETGGFATPPVTDTFEPDECCGTLLSRALRKGIPESLDAWMCGKCGMEWKPTLYGSLRHWTPRPLIAVLGGGR